MKSKFRVSLFAFIQLFSIAPAMAEEIKKPDSCSQVNCSESLRKAQDCASGGSLNFNQIWERSTTIFGSEHKVWKAQAFQSKSGQTLCRCGVSLHDGTLGLARHHFNWGHTSFVTTPGGVAVVESGGCKSQSSRLASLDRAYTFRETAGASTDEIRSEFIQTAADIELRDRHIQFEQAEVCNSPTGSDKLSPGIKDCVRNTAAAK